ncbi:AEC family transporter [Arthrobacter citreus]|uniref:AEC family transporter n=1 Tax=Arthrobacter citreus TaxID=1670 RepID=A0ABZ2ZSP3_9MICC
MLGVIEGFAVVLIIAAVGYAFAAIRRDRGPDPKAALTSVIYYVTNPALMFILLAEAPVEEVLRTFAPAALLIAVASGAVYAGLSFLFFRRSAADTAVGAMSASYANAGNIGLPIALYAVGSSTPVVSVLMAQLLVLAPAYLAVFSFTQRRRAASGPGALAAGNRARVRPLAVLAAVVRPFANPVTLATLAGLALALTGLRLPAVLWEPVSLLGHASVPLLLLTFGMSLYGQNLLGTAAVRTDVLVSTAVKLLAAPLLGYAVGRWIFGLDGVDLFGVVVMSALPTAQNVYLFSHQFGMKSVIARDVVFLTSILSFPVILLAAVLLA